MTGVQTCALPISERETTKIRKYAEINAINPAPINYQFCPLDPTRLHLVCWFFLYHTSSTIILVFISSLCPIQVHSPLTFRNNQSCKVKQHVHFCHDPLGVCWACYNSAAMGGDHNTGLGPYLIPSQIALIKYDETKGQPAYSLAVYALLFCCTV